MITADFINKTHASFRVAMCVRHVMELSAAGDHVLLDGMASEIFAAVKHMRDSYPQRRYRMVLTQFGVDVERTA